MRSPARIRELMNRRTFLTHSTALLGATALARAQSSTEHVTVWREAGRYGGWPANHGIWSWGDEVLVGFTAGVLKTGDPMRHPIDRSAGEQHVLSRSLDGGRTWRVEVPVPLQPPPRPERRAVTGEPLRLPDVQRLATPLDFTAPGLALTFRASHGTPGAWLYVGHDRGRRWSGPYQVPAFDTPGLDPRTDYLVVGPRELLVFMTALKTNGKEGRPLAIRTRDGGLTWERLGWIGPETDGFRIMPATVALEAGHLFSVIRRRDDTRHSLEGYRSRDGGATWTPTGVVRRRHGPRQPGESRAARRWPPVLCLRVSSGALRHAGGRQRRRGRHVVGATHAADGRGRLGSRLPAVRRAARWPRGCRPTTSTTRPVPSATSPPPSGRRS